MIKTGKVAKQLGISQESLNRLVRQGEIAPDSKTESGHNLFSQETINNLIKDETSRINLLTSYDVADMLFVCQKTVVRLEEKGELIPYKRTKGGHRRYTKSQVEEYMKGSGMYR